MKHKSYTPCEYNKNLCKKTYYRNLRYPNYMAKVATITYLLEDLENDYCFVDATYVIPN
jgi:isoprenylcysteine carboxyl methyltransferase (ICMT) family protein YpbQ